jgi:hypothetical protein
MADIDLADYASLLGSQTVRGMAAKVGLNPPPPPISVRNLVKLAANIIKPLTPTILSPPNGATVYRTQKFSFVDPGFNTPTQDGSFHFQVTQNGVVVGPYQYTNVGNPITPGGVSWGSALPTGTVRLEVWGTNQAGAGPSAFSTFTVWAPSSRYGPPERLRNNTASGWRSVARVAK